MDHIATFNRIYGYDPQAVAFCPYRVCPIGAHSDHQYGKITGFAIDKGIHIAYSPKHNGVVEMVSLNFPKRAQFHVAQIPELRQNDWADYLRGAAAVLNRTHPLHTGLCGVIEGTLPIGGLSSSAAVIIAFLSSLCRVNDISLSNHELIVTALVAENEYVGVSCGKMDQSCEVYSKKDHLLYLDTRDDSYETIPQNPGMKPYEIAVFFSGVQRTLTDSKFNLRVDECKSAAYALMAYEGMEYGGFENARLRDVPYETYMKHRHKLPENFSKRADHWYGEYDRVQRGVEAWREGDIAGFGRLSFESGRSSIYNYETGSPELIKLYEIMLRTDGVYGGRFCGAGFKGCSMALIDPDFREAITQSVTAEYTGEFPGLRDKFSVHLCKSADGVSA